MVHYEHTEVGFNYRMSNLLAAVGRGQLENLEGPQAKLARRSATNQRYREAFASIDGVSFQPVPQWSTPNWWLTCIVLDPAVHGTDATQRVTKALEAEDIESRPLWKPMHLQPVFADSPARLNGVSERLFGTGMCLPSGSSMTTADVDRVSTIVAELLTR